MAITGMNHIVLYVRDARRQRGVLRRRARVRDHHRRTPTARSSSCGRRRRRTITTSPSSRSAAAPTQRRPGGAPSACTTIAWEVPTLDELAEMRDRPRAGRRPRRRQRSRRQQEPVRQDPDGLEFEVMWLVPPERWGDEEHEAIIRPLDLDADRMPLRRRRGSSVTARPGFSPIERRTVAEQIRDRMLAGSIRTGDLAPGERRCRPNGCCARSSASPAPRCVRPCRVLVSSGVLERRGNRAYVSEHLPGIDLARSAGDEAQGHRPSAVRDPPGDRAADRRARGRSGPPMPSAPRSRPWPRGSRPAWPSTTSAPSTGSSTPRSPRRAATSCSSRCTARCSRRCSPPSEFSSLLYATPTATRSQRSSSTLPRPTGHRRGDRGRRPGGRPARGRAPPRRRRAPHDRAAGLGSEMQVRRSAGVLLRRRRLRRDRATRLPPAGHHRRGPPAVLLADQGRGDRFVPAPPPEQRAARHRRARHARLPHRRRSRQPPSAPCLRAGEVYLAPRSVWHGDSIFVGDDEYDECWILDVFSPPRDDLRERLRMSADWRLAVDIGGTFTDVVLLDAALGPGGGRQDAHHAACTPRRRAHRRDRAARTRPGWRPPTSPRRSCTRPRSSPTR